MHVQTLGGIPVRVTIPTTNLQNFGLIKGVPLWYTDAQLAEFLQPEGVVAARRHYRRQGKPGDAATLSDRVVLTFRPNRERPSKVNLGRRQKFAGRGSVSRNDWLRLLTARGRSQDSRFENVLPFALEITRTGARCRYDSHHAARLPQPP
ncbi:hypothetical protein HPB47_003542 [Ixodes persulcatus]|uniref:Uncharacterized protein n=1 Tax=Ixodes persulcatus TaxID=34615 RepID=A0AC60PJ77_IXOPE|nr:hypothetical protein HPB47_003542 [Ixodes persulcatus]